MPQLGVPYDVGRGPGFLSVNMRARIPDRRSGTITTIKMSIRVHEGGETVGSSEDATLTTFDTSVHPFHCKIYLDEANNRVMLAPLARIHLLLTPETDPEQSVIKVGSTIKMGAASMEVLALHTTPLPLPVHPVSEAKNKAEVSNVPADDSDSEGDLDFVAHHEGSAHMLAPAGRSSLGMSSSDVLDAPTLQHGTGSGCVRAAAREAFRCHPSSSDGEDQLNPPMPASVNPKTRLACVEESKDESKDESSSDEAEAEAEAAAKAAACTTMVAADDPVCYVCFDTHSEQDNDPLLYSPCKCRSPVHRLCLRAWMDKSVPRSTPVCSICRARVPYDFGVIAPYLVLQVTRHMKDLVWDSDREFLVPFSDKPDRTVSLGTDSSCDVKLIDPSVSAHHCSIVAKKGKFYVKDHEQEHSGTYLQVNEDFELPLDKQLTFKLGRTVLTLLAVKRRVGREA